MKAETLPPETDKQRKRDQHTGEAMSSVGGIRQVFSICPLSIALLFVALLSSSVLAGAHGLFAPVPDDRLTSAGGSSGDSFGASASVWNETAIVGAPDEGEGSAYFFTRINSTWSQEAKLEPPRENPLGTFGERVVVTEELAAVSAPLGDGGDGYVAVYRHHEGGWELETILEPKISGDNRNLGDGLAIDRNRVLAGVPGDDTMAENAGAVAVFADSDDGWTRTATLRTADSPKGASLGMTVGASEGVAVAGAPFDHPHGSESGSAYVFEENADGSWTQSAKLVAPDGDAGDRFGAAVTTDGSTIAVAAPRTDVGIRDDAGAVYTFTPDRDADTWTFEQQLIAPDAENRDWFGTDISLQEGTLAIGTPGHEGFADQVTIHPPGFDPLRFDGHTGGAVYTYEQTDAEDQFVLSGELTDEDTNTQGDLGTSVAVDEATVIAGSPSTGTAFVYEATTSPG